MRCREIRCFHGHAFFVLLSKMFFNFYSTFSIDTKDKNSYHEDMNVSASRLTKKNSSVAKHLNSSLNLDFGFYYYYWNISHTRRGV